MLRKTIGLRSATILVVTNMIGAGIFTTTGYQAADIGHPALILLLWLVGAFLAWCGALCYAELGAAMPKIGAEYAYLRFTYGPMVGFMSAFVSLVAGFSAPIAAAAKSFIAYLSYFVPALADPIIGDACAIGVVWIFVAIHARRVHSGVLINDLITGLKLAGMVAIIVAAFTVGNGDFSNFGHVMVQPRGSLLPALGTALIFVMFCYSGWNASAYLAAEMVDPQRDLPRSLLLGTGIVGALYLGLNAVYFYAAPVNELAGQAEVGVVAAQHLFGPIGVALMTAVLCCSILASASAMTIAGARVTYAVGADFPHLKIMSATGRNQGPVAALLLQGAVTTTIVLSGTIDQIQHYAGFTLTLFGSLAVSCVIVLRRRVPGMERPFRVWAYPLTPLCFLAGAAGIMFWAMWGRPVGSLIALATVLVGGAIFRVFLAREP